MSNVVCIIQARLTSTRLPNKVLLPICGKPMLWHLIERVKRCKLISEIVVAMPFSRDNSKISKTASLCGVNSVYHKGKIDDLVGRHLAVAKKFKADVVVRIPSDNPCIEPSEVDRIIEAAAQAYHPNQYMYSNTHNIKENGYSDGLGAEVYSMKLLQWINFNATTQECREHPHKICYDKDIVKTIPCPEDIRRPELRLDVNTQKDFDFITEIYEALYPKNHEFGIRDIIAYLDDRKDNKSLQNKLASKPFYKETMLNDLFKKVLM